MILLLIWNISKTAQKKSIMNKKIRYFKNGTILYKVNIVTKEYYYYAPILGTWELSNYKWYGKPGVHTKSPRDNFKDLTEIAEKELFMEML